MPDVGVIVPAGGAGRRMGGRAKAELELAGIPMLQRAIEPFRSLDEVRTIVVPLPGNLLAHPPDWLRQPGIELVAGGAERRDSVRAGLDALGDTVEIVVIHDAARPLVRADLIRRVIEVARTGTGAMAALPATDTLHVVDERGRILQTPDRSHLWQAQTPQAFPRAMIQAAHRRALDEDVAATDDAALVVKFGGTVQVVRGERDNLKITEPMDVELAAFLLRQSP